MAGKYQAYPQYAGSGVSSLGAIPTHWSTQKVNYLFAFGRGLNITKADLEDTGIACVSYGEVHSKYGFEVDPNRHVLKCVSNNYLSVSPRALLSPGDFVFADTSEDIDGAGNFTQFVGEGQIFAGYHTVILRPKKHHDPRFLAYAFDTAESRNQIRLAVKGVKVFSITQEILKNVFLVLPTYSEQRTIAAFLDHETARIDRLIEKQQRLIELLKEKRQAVISHAVTKGLDPDVPMKDSGVEWLGQVPEHWSLSQPRYLCQFFGGGTPSKDNPDFWNGDIPWVSPKDMKREVIAETIDSITTDAVRHSSTKLIPVESILIVVRGMILAHSVPVAITSAPVTINQDMKAMVCNGRIEPNYYLLCLQGLRSTILDLVDSSAHGTKCLRTEQFEQVYIPLPPIEEQKAIVATVKYRLKRMDKTIVAASKSIELARERRTALISAAVTGKIDVRNWQPNTSTQVAESDLPMAAEQTAEYRV